MPHAASDEHMPYSSADKIHGNTNFMTTRIILSHASSDKHMPHASSDNNNLLKHQAQSNHIIFVHPMSVGSEFAVR